MSQAEEQVGAEDQVRGIRGQIPTALYDELLAFMARDEEKLPLTREALLTAMAKQLSLALGKVGEEQK